MLIPFTLLLAISARIKSAFARCYDSLRAAGIWSLRLWTALESIGGLIAKQPLLRDHILQRSAAVEIPLKFPCAGTARCRMNLRSMPWATSSLSTCPAWISQTRSFRFSQSLEQSGALILGTDRDGAVHGWPRPSPTSAVSSHSMSQAPRSRQITSKATNSIKKPAAASYS